MNPQALRTGLSAVVAAVLIAINAVSPHAYASHASWSSPATSVCINPGIAHTSAGIHTIAASVTDSGGMSGTATVTVTVVSPAPSGSAVTAGGATLTARGYKTKGRQQVDLSWSGLGTSQTDVYRNNVRVTTTANGGSYTDNIGGRGSGTYTYRVCDGGTATCSNSVTISF